MVVAVEMADTAAWIVFCDRDTTLEASEACEVNTSNPVTQCLSVTRYLVLSLSLSSHRFSFINDLHIGKPRPYKNLQGLDACPQQDNPPNGPPFRPKVIRVRLGQLLHLLRFMSYSI